jgi:hypothetical protein
MKGPASIKMSANPTRWVQQQDAYGCGIAALAMICGHGYDQVKEWFLLHGRDIVANKGGTWWDWDVYLTEHGFAVARKFPMINNEPRAIWPPEPFGDIHLCEVRPCSSNLHAVVMLADGRILDPLFPLERSLSRYPCVESVAAIARI